MYKFLTVVFVFATMSLLNFDSRAQEPEQIKQIGFRTFEKICFDDMGAHAYPIEVTPVLSEATGYFCPDGSQFSITANYEGIIGFRKIAGFSIFFSINAPTTPEITVESLKLLLNRNTAQKSTTQPRNRDSFLLKVNFNRGTYLFNRLVEQFKLNKKIFVHYDLNSNEIISID